MKKGKFIVIEGTDGSGKATQVNLLIKQLKSKGIKVKKFDFPQYGKKSCGLVEEYLNGKYGSPKQIGPLQASIFYAVDRFDASYELKKSIEKGINIISNRYVGSNIAHQGGKIANENKRKSFIRWVEHLEYEIFNIPKPDLNIILHVTPDISQQMIDKKNKRAYLKGKKRDIHEKDINHLKNAETVYLQLAKLKNYQKITCFKQKKVLPISDIQQQIWKKVYALLK